MDANTDCKQQLLFYSFAVTYLSFLFIFRISHFFQLTDQLFMYVSRNYKNQKIAKLKEYNCKSHCFISGSSI